MKRTAGALRQRASELGLPLGHRRWLSKPVSRRDHRGGRSA